MTQRGPFTDPAVRQAISAGVDRTALGVEGESGYETAGDVARVGSSCPARPRTWSRRSRTTSRRPGPDQGRVDPDRRRVHEEHSRVLREGWSADHVLHRRPDRLLGLLRGHPARCRQELQAEGIDCTVDGVEASQWYTDLGDGNFQSIDHWGNGGVTRTCSSTTGWTTSLRAPIGTAANADYGRYHNAAAQSALTTLASTNPATRRLS